MAVLGCGRTLTDAQYIERGKSELDKGDIRAAAIEFKSVLRKNPDNPEARFLLGKLYLLQENGPAAEQTLQRAQDLKIPLTAMIMEFGRSLLLQDKYQAVLDTFPPQLGDTPQQRAAVMALRSQAYLGLGKMSEAADAAQAALALEPDGASAGLAMARVIAIRDSIPLALSKVAEVTARNKDEFEAWLMRGELQRLNGQLKESRQAYTQAVTLRPYSFRAYIGRTQTALALGDLAAADADLQSALGLIKKHPIAMYLQGVIDVKKGQYQEALTMFQKVSEAIPGFKPVVFWLGVTHAALGHFAQAQDFASTYVKAYPDAVEGRKLMGYVALQQKDPAGALKVLASLDSDSRQDSQLSTLLGAAYLQTGNADKGMAYLRQAADAPEAPAAARARYSVALADEGKADEAQEQLRQAVEADPSLIDAELAVIQKLIQGKDYAGAAKALDEAEQRHPKDPRLLNLRGGLALSQGKLDEAATAFQKALDTEPGFAPAAHNLALMALRKGDVDKARSYYQQVVKRHPDHVPTLVALYYLDKREGHDEQAIAWVEKAVEKAPEHAMASTLLAREYLARGDALKALSATEAATTAHPKDEGLLEVRGLAQLETGQAGNALRAFSDLVSLRPKAANAYFYRAQAQAALGKPAETRKDLEKALSLDPKHGRAMEALAKLEIQSGNTAKAAKLADDLKKQFPKQPEGWLVDYELAMVQKQYGRASKTMHELMDKGFVTTVTVLDLSRADWAGGNKDEALDQVRAWLKLHDKDVEALLYMAAAEDTLGHGEAAQKYYENVLALRPDHPAALNNLAWLLRDKDSARAQTLAEKAVKLQPDSPPLADTLAVILMARGDNQRAAQLLRGFVGEGKKGAPAGLRYHYAQALVGTGKKQEAKALLTSLVADDAAFAEKASAQSLLKEISP